MEQAEPRANRYVIRRPQSVITRPQSGDKNFEDAFDCSAMDRGQIKGDQTVSALLKTHFVLARRGEKGDVPKCLHVRRKSDLLQSVLVPKVVGSWSDRLDTKRELS